MKKAYGYIRVSSKGQIDGDGFARQEKAIADYAKTNGYEIIHIYREEGVSGTLIDRPALGELMLDIESTGSDIQTVIIERIDRLARDLMIQETILNDIRTKGINIISATDGDLLENDPTRKLVRQVLGAIAEYDKTMTVLKLKASRDRIRKTGKKCEGRKSYKEVNPAMINEIKTLRRKPRNGNRLSLEKTLEALQEKGFTTASGKTLNLTILKNVIYKAMQ